MIDFTLREGVEDRWDQRLYKWWFAHDGVYFNRAHVGFLEQQRDLETVWYSENEGRVPYTPFMPTHYMYCAEKISIEKKKTNNRRINGRSPSPTPRACAGAAASSPCRRASARSVAQSPSSACRRRSRTRSSWARRRAAPPARSEVGARSSSLWWSSSSFQALSAAGLPLKAPAWLVSA